MSILTSCQKCHGEIDVDHEDLPSRACDLFTVVCGHCNQEHICNWYPEIDIRIKQDQVKNETKQENPTTPTEAITTYSNCEICGEFECESCSEYEDSFDWEDDDYLFDGSGMVSES